MEYDVVVYDRNGQCKPFKSTDDKKEALQTAENLKSDSNFVRVLVFQRGVAKPLCEYAHQPKN